MAKFQVGDSVTVHAPAWRDAAGRIYAAGKHHGEPGTIVAVTDYRVGAERIYDVKLDRGPVRHFWTGQLRSRGRGAEATEY